MTELRALREFIREGIDHPLDTAHALISGTLDAHESHDEISESDRAAFAALEVDLIDATVAAVQAWLRQPRIREFMYNELAKTGLGPPLHSVQRGLAAKAGEP